MTADDGGASVVADNNKRKTREKEIGNYSIEKP